MDHTFLSSHPPHSPKQLQRKLTKQLRPDYISTRPSSSDSGAEPYLEDWKAVNLANEIFGYDGWSSDVVALTTNFVDFHEASQRHTVAVTATVKVTVATGASHSDIGFSVVENAQSKGQALEKAQKQATSAALTHTLRLFGNLLGNCLYDKDFVGKLNLSTPEPRIVSDDKALQAIMEATPEKSLSETAALGKPPQTLRPTQDPAPLGADGLEDPERKADDDLADRLSTLIEDANARVVPLTKMIREYIEAMLALPDAERNEYDLVKQVKPLLQQAEKILHETEAAIRLADPDNRLSSKAARNTKDHVATLAEQRLANGIKILVEEVGGTTEWSKQKLESFPKAKLDLGPLLDAVSHPLIQIVGGVALLLGGVLTIVWNLLDELGLGGLLKGLVGGLVIDKIYGKLILKKLFRM